MDRVLIAGGSGLIGQHLAKHLEEKGYAVQILSRYAQLDSKYKTYSWQVTSNEIDKEALCNIDFIINLAGANIGDKRWTSKRKKEILASRVNSTALLFEAVQKYNIPIKAFVSASAVGYYGAITSDTIFSEKDKPSTDFLGNVCERWEEASHQFSNNGIRTVQIRTGVVLTPIGGALAKMLQPIMMGVGAALGSGKQYIPWIHITDLCKIYESALQNSNMQGAYNAVAPKIVTNTVFTKKLATHIQKKIFLPPIPKFVLKLLLGEMADIVLYGSRVSTKKIESTGFVFTFSKLSDALDDLVLVQQ